MQAHEQAVFERAAGRAGAVGVGEHQPLMRRDVLAVKGRAVTGVEIGKILEEDVLQVQGHGSSGPDAGIGVLKLNVPQGERGAVLAVDG